MQPEPLEAFQQISTTTTNTETSVSTQHGSDREQSDSGPTGRESSASTRADIQLSRSKADRIAEYERALAPSPKPTRHGPGFKVLQTVTTSTRLDEFPNEVLTHILSHLPASSLGAMSLVSKRFYTLVTTPHAWRIAFARFFPGPNADADENDLRAERSLFTRLTAVSTWRSEYIMRTRLLRALGRGKPFENTGRSGSNAVTTYSSQQLSRISHLHAIFGSGKKGSRCVHGSEDSGVACKSDPTTGKVDGWGLSDPQALPQFEDLHPGDQMYGWGSGPVGVPNVMDVSQPFGVVYGQGFPGGGLYFRGADEMRGRFLAHALPSHNLRGVPRVPITVEAVTAVWIAKSLAVPMATDCVGVLSATSLGIVSAYAIGGDGRKEELTARWVLSPGVPIIGLAVDDAYAASRKSNGRVWAVALNALGECFYLTGTPQRPSRGTRPDESTLEVLAWQTGRTMPWRLIETTKRAARENAYQDGTDHCYSPQISDSEQMDAEIREVERFFALKPSHFREACTGWDMRRRLEVDFAGDDGHGAGEAVFVIDSGAKAGIKRFTRWHAVTTDSGSPSDSGPTWRASSFASRLQVEITASAVDTSKLALLTADEDIDDAPGQRARLMAIGTQTGAVVIWDMRAPQPANDAIVNDVHPVHIIQTDSPQISCLAMSSLYLVHGGNDGLVQAWDPLASTDQPIRTLHSRFSSRARRRLVQAEAADHGVGINLFAAGAICLDPDPTVLRGVMSLGTHLRYWHFSAAGDQYHGKKRRLRRPSERGSNAAHRVVSSGRGALTNYIATEQAELKQEAAHQARKQAWLRGRFGVGLGGLSDLEAIQYAEMVSREAFEKEEERRLSDTGYAGDVGESSSAPSQSFDGSGTVTPEGSEAARSPSGDHQLDRDIEEAIRLSLLEESVGSPSSPSFSIKYKKTKGRSVSPKSPTPGAADDLEMALQLSLDQVTSDIDFPTLDSVDPSGKGKGRV